MDLYSQSDEILVIEEEALDFVAGGTGPGFDPFGTP